MFACSSMLKARSCGLTARRCARCRRLSCFTVGPASITRTSSPTSRGSTEIAQVVYVDHRGNGRSDRGDPAKWNLPQWGDDVRSFCEALEIERPIVMGISFGGMVAMSYATRHPDHPAKLVLSSTAAQIRQDRSLNMFERLGGAEVREAALRFFENPGPETMPDFQNKCFPVYTRTPMGPEFTKRAVTNFDLTVEFFKHESHTFNFLHDLGRIKCPTLIAAGELDPITAGCGRQGHRGGDDAGSCAARGFRERRSRSTSRPAGSLLQSSQRIYPGVTRARWHGGTSLRDFSNSSRN